MWHLVFEGTSKKTKCNKDTNSVTESFIILGYILKIKFFFFCFFFAVISYNKLNYVLCSSVLV